MVANYSKEYYNNVVAAIADRITKECLEDKSLSPYSAIAKEVDRFCGTLKTEDMIRLLELSDNCNVAIEDGILYEIVGDWVNWTDALDGLSSFAFNQDLVDAVYKIQYEQGVTIFRQEIDNA